MLLGAGLESFYIDRQEFFAAVSAMSVWLKLGMIAAALFAFAPDADAHGCCRGGSRVFLGFNFWVPPPYYYPPPVYYYGPPVAYVERAPAIQPSPQINLGPSVGQGCREYTAPMTVGGRVVEGYGIACPRPDGSWQIVN
jgi:hypothetical protein